MPSVGALKLRLQVLRGTEPAIGPGKAAVLEAIEEHGSISAAGRALGMSYRRTWLLVSSLNHSWAERVVQTRTGGGHDRGASVTLFGHKLLSAYRALEEDVITAAQGKNLDWMVTMLAPPLLDDCTGRGD